MQRFTDIKAWQRNYQSALQVHRITKTFPVDERFGLTSQLRRAAYSVPTNIAEGSKRRHSQDYARFLNIAEGSLAEVECLLMMPRDLGYLDTDSSAVMLAEATEIGSMLNALRVRVEQAASSLL